MEKFHPMERSVAYRLLQVQMDRIVSLCRVMTALQAVVIVYLEVNFPKHDQPLPPDKEFFQCSTKDFPAPLGSVEKVLLKLEKDGFISIVVRHRLRWVRINHETIQRQMERYVDGTRNSEPAGPMDLPLLGQNLSGGIAL